MLRVYVAVGLALLGLTTVPSPSFQESVSDWCKYCEPAGGTVTCQMGANPEEGYHYCDSGLIQTPGGLVHYCEQQYECGNSIPPLALDGAVMEHTAERYRVVDTAGDNQILVTCGNVIVARRYESTTVQRIQRETTVISL